MNKVKQILIVFFGVCVCAGLLASQTIFEAAKKGDVAALKAILEKDPGLINAPAPAFPEIAGPYLGQTPPGLSPRMRATS